MAVVQWPCSKEQALSQSPTSVNRGNGHEKHAPVGLNVDGWTYRDLMQFTLAWAGVYQITKAKLWLQDTGAVHVTFGGSPRVTVQRITGSWNENGGLEGDWWTTATTVWPGPGTAGGGIDSVNLPSNADKWGSIDITSIVEQWAPATVKRSDGTPGGAVANYGVRLISFNEAGTASTVEPVPRRSSGTDDDLIPLRPADWWEPDEWCDLLAGELGPWAMSMEAGQVTALCHTSRLSERAAEAGVWAHPNFRGHGRASAATAVWAGHPDLGDRVRFYSTSSDNGASRRVAAKLGLRPIGWIWKLSVERDPWNEIGETGSGTRALADR